MFKSQEKKIKAVQSLIGIFILVLGITLILVWRCEVMILLRGAMGICLALGGLLILYGLSKK